MTQGITSLVIEATGVIVALSSKRRIMLRKRVKSDICRDLLELENINDVARILQVKYQRKEHTEDKGRGEGDIDRHRESALL